MPCPTVVQELAAGDNRFDQATAWALRWPGDGGTALAKGLIDLQFNKDKRGFGKPVRDLIKAKNDYRHDRGPSIEAEYRTASEESVNTGSLRKWDLYIEREPIMDTNQRIPTS